MLWGAPQHYSSPQPLSGKVPRSTEGNLQLWSASQHIKISEVDNRVGLKQ